MRPVISCFLVEKSRWSKANSTILKQIKQNKKSVSDMWSRGHWSHDLLLPTDIARQRLEWLTRKLDLTWSLGRYVFIHIMVITDCVIINWRQVLYFITYVKYELSLELIQASEAINMSCGKLVIDYIEHPAFHCMVTVINGILFLLFLLPSTMRQLQVPCRSQHEGEGEQVDR